MRRLLALCLALAWGSALAAPHEGVARIVSDRLPIGQAQGRAAAVHRLGPAPSGNPPRPGHRAWPPAQCRDLFSLRRNGHGSGRRHGGHLVIAPQFLNETDVQRHRLPDTLLRWQGNAWMGGEPALGPQPLSSFAVFDALLARLAERRLLPNLQEVVIAGHSGGGQVVQRYAVLGQGEQALAAQGIRLRYVVANPSSTPISMPTDRMPRASPCPSPRRPSCPDFDT